MNEKVTKKADKMIKTLCYEYKMIARSSNITIMLNKLMRMNSMTLIKRNIFEAD